MERQHCTPNELIYTNVKGILSNIITKLESQDCSYKVDFAHYKIDWLILLLLRLGGLIENSLLPFLLEAQQILIAAMDNQEENFTTISPSVIKTGMKGGPKFDIPVEQLLYLLEKGFKVTNIAGLMCVSEKTIHRRLQNNGM